MNSKCDGCHRTEAFVASILPAHRDAGITCTSCHSEHRGEDSTLVPEALESCAKCHNDQNKKRYNGRSVSTPHGGTYGYPVLNGVWIWKGYAAEQLANKQELIRFLKQNRVDATQTQEWRNAQFHGVHVHRVRVIASIDGIDGGGGERVLSCTSCHKAGYMGVNVDRSYPRTTCGRCHNTKIFKETSLDESQRISCTSCHVEHPKDPHWASSLLSSQANEAERGPNQ